MNNKISCIITDDEPFARKGLQGYVEKIGFLQLKGVCEDAMQLDELLKEHTVDLLFLDIQMPYVTGVDFLKAQLNPPKVIFTTAFSEYALQGFELDVLDYLLKPISYDRFLKAAWKARDYFELKTAGSPSADYLFVKAESKLEKVNFADILYVEGMENYIAIYTAQKRLITHSTFKSFLQKLPAHQFIQTHKSYIVAVDKVTAIEGNRLFIDKLEVPVGRQSREEVMEMIINRRRL